MLLQQVPEHENRCVIWDPMVVHIYRCESAHRRHLDLCILHRWIAEVVALLLQMDAQHGRVRIGRATTLGTVLG